MKFTLSWLKEHLETTASLTEITDKLTAIGLELEEVHDPAARLAPFTIARVKSAVQHPDADKLRVCVVETKDHGEVQVVCGAPNARTGMMAVFAPAGAYVPGIDLVLKKGMLRGQESNGMLVSERELEISEEHDGIIDLPADAPFGAAFAEYVGLNDPVIEIGLTPNRGDCAGVRGIARDLAAAGLGSLKPQRPGAGPGSIAADKSVVIETDSQLCPVFAYRVIKGVKNGPSPIWLQNQLKAIGLRPISALVDVTNWMAMDLARPLHAFDAGRMQGDKLTVRMAQQGEQLTALNGKNYSLDASMVAIADGAGVDSIAGVMGGERTGCQLDTTDVILEAALWDPSKIAWTGRKLDINSDARFRFERGTDPQNLIEGLEIATKFVLDVCGGAASDTIIAGSVPVAGQTQSFRFSEIKNRGGIDVDRGQAFRILADLGFTAEGDSAAAVVTLNVPSWRTDIQGEADIVEEVCRIIGLDEIPAVSLLANDAWAGAAFDGPALKKRAARRALAAQGLMECVTWSFLGRPQAELFGEVNDDLTLENAMSVEMDTMRASLLPNLIAAAGRNADRGFANVALFEVGTVFKGVAAADQPAEAAAVRAGKSDERHWATAPKPVDLFDAKADAIAALAAAGAPVSNLQVRATAPGYYHPGRSGSLCLGKAVLACFGELHPRTLKAMDVKGPMVATEIYFGAIPPARKKGTAKPLLTLPPLMSLDRDFAFVVDEGVAADQLLKAAKGADKQLITNVVLFDVYQGKGMAEGKKSLAFTVTLQPKDVAVTDEQIEAVSQKVVAAVVKATGGELRG